MRIVCSAANSRIPPLASSLSASRCSIGERRREKRSVNAILHHRLINEPAAMRVCLSTSCRCCTRLWHFLRCVTCLIKHSQDTTRSLKPQDYTSILFGEKLVVCARFNEHKYLPEQVAKRKSRKIGRRSRSAICSTLESRSTHIICSTNTHRFIYILRNYKFIYTSKKSQISYFK
uniref:Uncharacterized protein n=1 Tax=Trichogramma kaykai TaxID=54128 RepID=A0ABD2WCN4_9HYME